jgi:hypothetical protein
VSEVPAETVALVALVYRELAEPCATGPRTGPDSIYAEFADGGDQVSLVALYGTSALTDLDWFLLRALDAGPVETLAEDLADVDLLRSEALLHASPETVSPRSFDELVRWREVEEKMQEFREMGLTATREDVELIAVSASGLSIDEYIRRHEEEQDAQELAWPE